MSDIESLPCPRDWKWKWISDWGGNLDVIQMCGEEDLKREPPRDGFD